MFFSLGEQASAAKSQAQACDPRCYGSRQNISYPFWIKGGLPFYCGYPTFKLNYKHEHPALSLFGEDYFIQEIFYSKKSVVPEKVYIFLSTCSFPTHNLTVDETPFKISSSKYVNLSFHGNCDMEKTSFFVKLIWIITLSMAKFLYGEVKTFQSKNLLSKSLKTLEYQIKIKIRFHWGAAYTARLFRRRVYNQDIRWIIKSQNHY